MENKQRWKDTNPEEAILMSSMNGSNAAIGVGFSSQRGVLVIIQFTGLFLLLTALCWWIPKYAALISDCGVMLPVLTLQVVRLAGSCAQHPYLVMTTVLGMDAIICFAIQSRRRHLLFIWIAITLLIIVFLHAYLILCLCLPAKPS